MYLKWISRIPKIWEFSWTCLKSRCMSLILECQEWEIKNQLGTEERGKRTLRSEAERPLEQNSAQKQNSPKTRGATAAIEESHQSQQSEQSGQTDRSRVVRRAKNTCANRQTRSFWFDRVGRALSCRVERSALFERAAPRRSSLCCSQSCRHSCRDRTDRTRPEPFCSRRLPRLERFWPTSSVTDCFLNSQPKIRISTLIFFSLNYLPIKRLFLRFQ